MRLFSLAFLALFALSCSHESPNGSNNSSSNNTNNTAATTSENNPVQDGGVDAAEDGATDADGGTEDPVPCTFDDTFTQAPPFTAPPEEEWNHSITSPTVAASGSPYHMIHDETALPGVDISITGKFDYNSVLHKDLQDEWVLLYIWGTGYTDWELLGRYLTDDDGKIHVLLDGKPEGQYILKGVVAGDLTEAHGYINVVHPGKKAIVFDIDGTITTSDSEVMMDWANFSPADMYPYADQVVDFYYQRGFHIVMVTGRPYWLATNTRDWLAGLGIPFYSIRFTSDNGTTVSGAETQQYKTSYLRGLQVNCDMNILRAYGNAETDIGAYDEVGIPKSDTFIIGENAGSESTQPISCDGCGYQQHYEDLLLPEDLQCTL